MGHIPNSLHFSLTSLTLLITFWETSPERLAGQHLLQNQEGSFQKSSIRTFFSYFLTGAPSKWRDDQKSAQVSGICRLLEWGRERERCGGGGGKYQMTLVIVTVHLRRPHTDKGHQAGLNQITNFPQFTLLGSCKTGPIPEEEGGKRG